MNDNLKMLIWAVVIILAVFLITNAQKPDRNMGYVGSNNIFTSEDDKTDHSSLWVSSTPYNIDANSSRQWMRFDIAPFSSSTVWIWQATSTELVATGKGIPLTATTTPSYTIDSTNLYIGEIQLISEGDTLVSWIEQP